MANIRKSFYGGKKIDTPIWNGIIPYALYYNGECVWKNSFTNPFVTLWKITKGEFCFPSLETIPHTGIIHWGDGTSEKYESTKQYIHYYEEINYENPIVSIELECDILALDHSVFKEREDLLYVSCPLVKTFQINEDEKGEQFYGCTNLTAVRNAGGIKKVPRLAFAECSKLQTYTPFTNLIEIDSSAFWGCGFTNSLTLPSTLKSIGYGAFACNYGLKNIFIPDSVETLGTDSASIYGMQFHLCNNITSIYVGDSYSSLRYIPPLVFNVPQEDSLLHTIKVAEGIKVMGMEGRESCFTCATGKTVTGENQKVVELYLPSTLEMVYNIIALPTTISGILYVYYNGNLRDWLNISKQGTVFQNCDIEITTNCSCYLICFDDIGETKLKFGMKSDGSISKQTNYNDIDFPDYL